MTLQIHEAKPGDGHGIEQLLRESGLPTAGIQSPHCRFLVARRAKQIAACGALERYGSSALMRSVAVAPGARSTGLGAAIVHALLEEARNDQLQTVVLLTTTAADWFPRFGFVRIDRDAIPAAMSASEELRGACPSSAVAMRWRPRINHGSKSPGRHQRDDWGEGGTELKSPGLVSRKRKANISVHALRLRRPYDLILNSFVKSVTFATIRSYRTSNEVRRPSHTPAVLDSFEPEA